MWKPSRTDIEWGQEMVRIMKEGGIWQIPITGQVFQFFRSKKEIHLIKGGCGQNEQLIFERTVLCFNAVGYKVMEARPNRERMEIKFEERGKGKNR